MNLTLDWNAILNAIIVFVLLILLRALLDFNLARNFVKYFYWIPLRNYFRTKPIKINGEWEEMWEIAGTEAFNDPTNRHSHPRIRQLDRYCYAEFIARGNTYGVFGRIVNNYFIGEWYDKKDPIGYFGTFHLLIVDSTTMKGKWIGHSKSKLGVREGDWNWKKL